MNLFLQGDCSILKFIQDGLLAKTTFTHRLSGRWCPVCSALAILLCYVNRYRTFTSIALHIFWLHSDVLEPILHARALLTLHRSRQDGDYATEHLSYDYLVENPHTRLHSSFTSLQKKTENTQMSISLATGPSSALSAHPSKLTRDGRPLIQDFCWLFTGTSARPT